MSCSFCCGTKRVLGNMSLENFRHVARQLSPLGVQIYLHVLGEPLMHAHLESILDVASEYNLPVNITTNGTIIRDKSDMLLTHRAVRKVNISVHSLEGANIDQSEAYLRDIADFGIKCAEHGRPIVNYRMWSGDASGDVSDNDTSVVQYIINAFGNQIEEGYNRGFLSIKLAKQVYICYDKQFEWPSENHEVVSQFGKCLGGRDMLAILVDGTVVPCCLDSEGGVNLGNIFSQSLSDIMSSERYEKLVTGFKGKAISEELCKRCAYRSRFDKKGDKNEIAKKKKFN